ncbi:MAG: NUDIX hydrolase [Parcubacteria group bacterium]
MELMRDVINKARDDGVTRFVVGAIILDELNRVLLLERPQSDFMAGIFELPSGCVESDEDLFQALLREVKEETGLIISSINKYAGHFDYNSSSEQKTRQFNFVVSAVDTNFINLSEHVSHKWARYHEINLLPITENVQKIIKGAIS